MRRLSTIISILLPLIMTPAPAWDLADWQPVTQDCATVRGEALVMVCESGGIISKHWYDTTRPIMISVVAQASGERYFAGLALNADVAADNRYTEAALVRNIAPWRLLGDYGAMLANVAEPCCVLLLPIGAGPHWMEVVYADGIATVSVDGASAETRIDLRPAVQIELLCVAVDPGESAPGQAATCMFTDLVISNELDYRHTIAE